MNETPEVVVALTREWLEKAVIGLGFCPFAASAHVRDRIRYRVSEQLSTDGLIEDFSQELEYLRDTDPEICETTLLIHPRVLTDFLDYNEFLETAEATIAALQLEGEIQVASFHPQYQFAGAEPDDIENYTNRSPYPMLHLLREASVTRAIDTYADINAISLRNIETLRALGFSGWQRLWRTSG